MLLDAVQTRKLVQLPLRLQYSLYDQAERIAHQLTSLVNGTDEIVNLVDSVEDITAAIWQYNLHNLSGEVLGLHEGHIKYGILRSNAESFNAGHRRRGDSDSDENI
jgi:hypothetical protein